MVIGWKWLLTFTQQQFRICLQLRQFALIITEQIIIH